MVAARGYGLAEVCLALFVMGGPHAACCAATTLKFVQHNVYGATQSSSGRPGHDGRVVRVQRAIVAWWWLGGHKTQAACSQRRFAFCPR